MLQLCTSLRTWRPKSEAFNIEGEVVLFRSFLVGPVVGAHPGFDNQLVSLARVSSKRFTDRSERRKPDAGYHLTGCAFFVATGIVVADQAESREDHFARRDELR